ncbi:hypothetical protein WR25_09106 isoform D [Diploscapter pachys]|nr:hypothetical protein WR25_09106 isoform B [Diploscapter pachys]PAV88095.1 hypothetical protein WR25_09106 isoform C [Diploscapter pachys]PAV88096.1 hypothetical protein WR25_09106 isoform D [Diploscapter pachys]
MEHIKDGLLDAMREVIQGLNNPEEATLSAANIATALSQHRWNITIGSEQDLYELFNVFVTTWDDELQYLKKCLMTSSLLELHLPSSSASESPSTSKASSSGLLTPILKRRGQEIKQLVFDRCCSLIRLDAQLRPPCLGYTSTQYRCSLQECGYKTTKFESFTALTLMIPKAFMGQPFSLEKLLRRYFCMELIRDAVCEKCKKEGKQTTGLFRKHGFSKMKSLAGTAAGIVEAAAAKLRLSVIFLDEFSYLRLLAVAVLLVLLIFVYKMLIPCTEAGIDLAGAEAEPGLGRTAVGWCTEAHKLAGIGAGTKISHLY